MVFVFQVNTPTGQKRRLGYERKVVGDQKEQLQDQEKEHEEEQTGDEEQDQAQQKEHEEEEEQRVGANGYLCDPDYPDDISDPGYESYEEMDYESNCRMLYEYQNEM
jgi:hypothetical protein